MSFDLDDEELKATREMKCNQKNYKFKEKAMSDEEKKAIVELKEEINKPLEVQEDKFDTFILYNIESAKIVINLIEKQSKEIEEYKKQLDLDYVKNNYTSNDKIKAILEEYKYTTIGDSEKIIEFYKKMQSLLEKE